MTTDDRALDLFTRANPVPDPDQATPTIGATDYLHRLERRSSTMTLTAPQTENPAAPTPPKRWPMVAAGVAAVALIAGLLVMATRNDDDVEPVDEPTPTTVAPEPDPEPEPAPDDAAPAGDDDGVASLPPASSQTVLVPGRYTSDMLGVDIEFSVPDDIGYVVLNSNRAGMILVNDGYPEELTAPEDYTLDAGIVATFQRLAGWSTPEEALLSRPDAATIDPNDVDRWIAANDVALVSDETISIDGRDARAIEISIEEPEEVAPLACGGIEWQCVYFGSVAEPADSARSRQDGLAISPLRQTRFWIVPIEGSVPLLITATVPLGADEWLDAFADGVVATMTIEGDVPPLRWTPPPEDAVNEEVPVSEDTAEDAAIEEATAVLDGWVDAWNAGDTEAVAALFGTDAVLVTSDNAERSGEDAGSYIAQFVSLWPTMARTSDGTLTESGAVSLGIEWTSPSGTPVPRIVELTIVDGALVRMDERLTES